MFEEQVEELLERAFEERSDLFLIEKTITPDHQVKIVIDGDQGVTVDDCIYVSRAIEHNLDREEIEKIATVSLEEGKGLHDLVQAVVSSRIFRSR